MELNELINEFTKLADLKQYSIEPSKISEKFSKHQILPQDYFYSFGNVSDNIYLVYTEIIKWLQLPFVEDNLENHDDRRQWYKNLDSDESKLVQQSKYRNNKISPLFIMYQLLQKLLQKAGVNVPSDLFPSPMSDAKLLGSPDISKTDRKEILTKWEHIFANIVYFIEKIAAEKHSDQMVA